MGKYKAGNAILLSEKKNKKHLVSIHIFLANSSYITIPYFKPMKKWTLVMCPEWKESLDFMYSSDDYYNGEINY